MIFQAAQVDNLLSHPDTGYSRQEAPLQQDETGTGLRFSLSFQEHRLRFDQSFPEDLGLRIPQEEFQLVMDKIHREIAQPLEKHQKKIRKWSTVCAATIPVGVGLLLIPVLARQVHQQQKAMVKFWRTLLEHLRAINRETYYGRNIEWRTERDLVKIKDREAYNVLHTGKIVIVFKAPSKPRGDRQSIASHAAMPVPPSDLMGRRSISNYDDPQLLAAALAEGRHDDIMAHITGGESSSSNGSGVKVYNSVFLVPDQISEEGETLKELSEEQAAGLNQEAPPDEHGIALHEEAPSEELATGLSPHEPETLAEVASAEVKAPRQRSITFDESKNQLFQIEEKAPSTESVIEQALRQAAQEAQEKERAAESVAEEGPEAQDTFIVMDEFKNRSAISEPAPTTLQVNVEEEEGKIKSKSVPDFEDSQMAMQENVQRLSENSSSTSTEATTEPEELAIPNGDLIEDDESKSISLTKSEPPEPLQERIEIPEEVIATGLVTPAISFADLLKAGAGESEPAAVESTLELPVESEPAAVESEPTAVESEPAAVESTLESPVEPVQDVFAATSEDMTTFIANAAKSLTEDEGGSLSKKSSTSSTFEDRQRVKLERLNSSLNGIQTVFEPSEEDLRLETEEKVEDGVENVENVPVAAYTKADPFISLYETEATEPLFAADRAGFGANPSPEPIFETDGEMEDIRTKRWKVAPERASKLSRALSLSESIHPASRRSSYIPMSKSQAVRRPFTSLQ